MIILVFTRGNSYFLSFPVKLSETPDYQRSVKDIDKGANKTILLPPRQSREAIVTHLWLPRATVPRVVVCRQPDHLGRIRHLSIRISTLLQS